MCYSGHKGKGYEVQVAETCHDPDVPVVDGHAERKVRPDELFADTWILWSPCEMAFDWLPTSICQQHINGKAALRGPTSSRPLKVNISGSRTIKRWSVPPTTKVLIPGQKPP